ncbi:MAG TPA: EscU/YscU/HrcU family type III secretion system export apparatus switch protein [Candidatus Dormibacteraeota bacterium]|nr:EscU/YscU/HrcU family type III secretion system export apparatus switch protein [Candidatus Dormibacteraeota bacterium]
MNRFFDFRKRRFVRPAAAALQYDPLKPEPPVVLAAGQGAIAEEIVRVARERGIPLFEDAALAQALAHLEINEAIPTELYAVVAEILVFVYRLDRRSAAGG